MTSLKSVLKLIRELINNKDYAGALTLIEEQFKSNVLDYNLLVFAGFAHFHLRNLDEAVIHYRSAIQMDSKAITAYQGLFEIFADKNWNNLDDEFVFTVFDFLLENVKDDRKFHLYKNARLNFLVRARKIDAILAEKDELVPLLTDQQAYSLLKILNTSYKIKQDNLNFGKMLLTKVDYTNCIDEDAHFAVCSFLFIFDNSNARKCLIDHFEKFPECSHEKLVNSLFAWLGAQLMFPSPNDEAKLLLKLVPRQKIASTTNCNYDISLCQKLAILIYDNKFNDAYDLLITVNVSGLGAFPLIHFAIYIFRQLGQFCRIADLLKDLIKFSGETLQNDQRLKLLEAKIEADFILAETTEEYETVLKWLLENFAIKNSFIPQHDTVDSLKSIFIQSQIRLNRILSFEQFSSTFNSVFFAQNETTQRSDSTRFYEFFLKSYFYCFTPSLCNLDTARDFVRQAISLAATSDNLSNSYSSNATILWVQILIERNQHQLAITQLVNCAQKHAYSFEVFRMLAESLFVTGVLKKAQLCAERAKLLNPRSERIAKFLYDIYDKQGFEANDRVKLINDLLLEKPNSMWALKQSIIFDINYGKLDVAIEKIQKLVRIKLCKRQMDEVEKQELCMLWIYLSEAYKQNGNLQSAVRACKAVLEYSPNNYSAMLQFIQLHQGMGHYEQALEVGTELMKRVERLSDEVGHFFRVLHSHSLILFITDEKRFVAEQREKLAELFPILRHLLTVRQCVTSADDTTSTWLLQKLVCRTFDILLSFNHATLSSCVEELHLSDDFWKISSRFDLLNIKLQYLCKVLKTRAKSADAWNDIALTLLRFYEVNTDEKLLDKCIFCLRNAIKLSNSRIRIAEFYCTLGKVYIQRKNAPMAQHCFLRALQLDRFSANAWCLLALLYFKINLSSQALRALSEAQKLDPHLMEVWCAMALHAEAAGSHEAMDLFRHSIVLKPTDVAVKKYCKFLMRCIQQKIPLEEGDMINFETIRDLQCKCSPTRPFLHSIALLAENFWHLNDAKRCIQLADEDDDQSVSGFRQNQMRILIKANMDVPSADLSGVDKQLQKLKTLYGTSKDQLFAELCSLPIFEQLFEAIDSDDLEKFRNVYKSTYCVLILTKISQRIFGILETVRPVHRLVDVFPFPERKQTETVLIQQQESDEIPIFARQDYLCVKLIELIKTMARNTIDAGVEINSLCATKS